MPIKLLILILTFSFSGYAQTGIDAVLENYKKDKDLQHASYSFWILEASSGKLLKEYTSEIALIPASTLKIVTTSAALGILGKDYSYKTGFYNFVTTDSLTGNIFHSLLVKGSGDPSFNSSYFFDSDSLFINQIIGKLKPAKNFKKITGSVCIDNSYFNNTIPSTWIWSDIGNYFGAGATGLSYRDNKFSLFYNSGAAGSMAELGKIKPAYFSKNMTFDSNVSSYGT